MPRSATNRIALSVLVLAVTAALACGDDGEDDDDGASSAKDSGAQTQRDAGGANSSDAHGGGKCDPEQMCDFACDGSCSVECLGARCTAKCPDGECALDADFAAIAAYDCEGGGCAIDCDGASECSVDCGGGGCQVGCDGDSSCKVSCAATGDPCTVTCEAGSVASCDNDNCELIGCEACDATDIDDSYKPSLEPADYSAVVDNPLWPLPVGGKWRYEAEDEVITITVLAKTYTTKTGVECVVVNDRATDKDGVLIEDTEDYFAQDHDGNVWYFGEKTAEYVNGKVANTRGSWEAGVDGALPGIVAHAKTPPIGTTYRQEYYRCEAEDMAEIVAVGESVKVPAGDYEDCVRVHEFNPLEPGSNEHKLLCPGVGVAQVYELAPGETMGGEPAESLIEVTLP